MKIEKAGTVKFKDVKLGQVFEYEGNIYMCCLILDSEGRTAANSVNLEKANYKRYDDKIEVTLYENAKVVLE